MGHSAPMKLWLRVLWAGLGWALAAAAPVRAANAVGVSAEVAGATGTDVAPAAPRPRIGLVLGGGGARGAAHVGVLQVLAQYRIPVDCVAGTSMGALVGAAFVSGLDADHMAQELARADWADLFQDSPSFTETAYRQKALSQRFVPGWELGVGADGVVAPAGVLSGQKIKLFFNDLVRADVDERPIEDLPLPLSIIATDIGTGRRVALRDGSVTTAMRASMSVPGLMSPVAYRGFKLVDGGLVDNVPIQEVRERCAPDAVIAVNVGSPLLDADKVGSFLTVSAQMINILTEQNVTRSLTQLRPEDVYIRPELGSISATDFERNREAVLIGRRAAEALADRLQAFSVSPQAYAQWWAGLAPRAQSAPVIDAIEIADISRNPAESVAQHITQEAGQVLDTLRLKQDLLRVFGQGRYQSVDYSLVTERERKILRITPLEKPWGPDYLRFALNLSSELRYGSSFNLRTAYHKTGLNALGAEALVSAEMGTQAGLGASFYQPLDRDQRWFIEPSVRFSSIDVPLYQNLTRVAEYKFRTVTSDLAFGRHFGRFGQVSSGLTVLRGKALRETGTPLLPEASDVLQGWFMALDVDRQDHLVFPTSGWSSHWRYVRYPGQGFDKLSANLQLAYPIGRSVLRGAVSYAGAPGKNLPIFDSASLGGFLNLSAYATRQFVGDRIAYGRLGAEHILGKAPLGMTGDLRFGTALEVAHIGRRFTEAQSTGNLHSLVFYFGGESPIGPVYLGLGLAHDSRNVYLSLGLR